MTRVLYLDTETYSEEPIKNGVHRYAEHPTTEVMLATWAWNGGPVEIAGWPSGAMLQALVDEADEVVIQNSAFDRTVLRRVLGVDVPAAKTIDTMVQAMAHSLPGSLDKLCDILGVPMDQAKHKSGKTLIQLFCKPLAANRTLRRATPQTHPVEWQRFREYAMSDIPSMREVRRRLPSWNYPDNARERALWVLDQTINERGIAVDLRLAEAAVVTMARAQKALGQRTAELTDGAVTSAAQRDALVAHVLAEYGVDLPDMQKATLERRLEDESLPDELRELLRVRLMTATTSVTKYKALMRAVSGDGRLRGTLQYCGAKRTGRWAGRIFQPQNLPRTAKAWKNRIDEAIQMLTADCADLVYGDEVMAAASNCIRSTLCAADGAELVASDLSNIEGRVLAWLAGEQWKIDAFANGDDLYVLGYSRSFGVPVAEVEADEKAGGTMRLIGKVQELALGYQGSVNAFGKMAALYGVSLPESRVREIVAGWRKANPRIVEFWYALERAFIRATNQPGLRVECGPLVLRRDGAWLRIRLPSGRFLCYPDPRADDDGCSYMGENNYTRKWERISTYGGKLVENVTQAVARDVLAWNMPAIEAAGFSLVLGVHDELVSETSNSDLTADMLSGLMSTNPPWAGGLPLAAAGWKGKRYRK